MAYTPPSYPYLPDVDFSTVVVPRETIASVSSASPSGSITQSDQQAQVAAENAPLRIPYGRVRLGAQVADVLVYNYKLIVIAIWGQGEIDSIEQVYMDDAVLPSTVTATHYLGTTGQTVNSTLVAAYAASGITFTDAFPDVAYSVFQVSATEGVGFPAFAATIKGRKVYDPRTTLTAWSDNPALCLADFIASTEYGWGKDVDWATVEDAADANDELVSGIARRKIGLALEAVTECAEWINVLRTYAGCFVVHGDNGYKLIPNRPASSVKSITSSSVVRNSLRVSKRGARNDPTVVTIRYVDTSIIPWREKQVSAYAPGVLDGSTPRRESEIPLPGIQSRSQAYREAVERLNHFLLEDLHVDVVLFDDGLEVEEADVITLTHQIGLTNKKFRVEDAKSQSPGRWTLKLREYDPAAYSDAVVADPTYTDTELPSPTEPPALTGLVATEEVFQLENGTFSSRIHLEWDDPGYAYLKDYRVEIYDGATLTHTGTSRVAEYATPAVQEGQTYACKVAVVSALGTVGAWAQADVTAQGKQLIPGDVPSITVFEVGGRVYVRWEPAIDVDIWRYEVRYGTTSDTWADATLLDLVDALRLESSDLSAGTWRIFVKAIDSIRQESTNAAYQDVTVTSDANSFFVDSFDSTTPQWLNAFLNSNSFSSSTWTKSNTSIVDVSGVQKLTENSDTSLQHALQRAVTTITGEVWTISVEIKDLGYDRGLRIQTGGSSNYTANTNYGIVNPLTGAVVATASDASVAVRELEDGWFRVSVTSTADASATAASSLLLLTSSRSGTTVTYNGGGSSGVGIRNMQLSKTPTGIEYGSTTATAITEGGKGMAKYVNPFFPTVEHYLTEDNVDFATKFSSNLSTYTDPLATYHASIDSVWVGEAEDFGQVLSGQFTGDVDAEALNGTLLTELGVSADGTTWDYLEGLSQKTTARFTRIRHSTAGTDTLKVTIPKQNVRLDAVAREENGFNYTSLASGGKLIQLENTYSAVKKIAITPEGSAARSASFDRVLIAPEHGLLFTDTSSGGGDSYDNYTISNEARVILSDDYFEYDVFVFERPTSEATGIGGFRIGFTDTSTTAGFTINDAEGRSLAQPKVSFGKWKSRKVSLSPVAGKTSDYWAMTRAADTAGDYKAVYRNIRITDGAGTTRLQVWESGEPPASYVEFSNLSTNAQAGPANSFHVYVFDSTPTQVANDFSWLFQGV